MKTLADYYPKIITISNMMPPEKDTRRCEPGDAILFEDTGTAYTLLEELMKDRTHVTWRALITAHYDESWLGREEWIGLSLVDPLEHAIIVRGS